VRELRHVRRSDPAQSHLVAPAAMLALVREAGFETVVFHEDAAAAGPSIQAAGAERMSAGLPGIDLALVMPDFEARMAGLGRNVGEGRITLVQGVMGRP
jgi:hypothetical protein